MDKVSPYELDADIICDTSGQIVKNGKYTAKITHHVLNCVETFLVVYSFARYEIKRCLEEVSFHDFRLVPIIFNIFEIDNFGAGAGT